MASRATTKGHHLRHGAVRPRDPARGEKSISIDSLYRVSVALAVPLRQLTDVKPGRRGVVPSKEAEKIFALVSGRHRPADVRRAYEVLRAMLDKA